MDKPRRHNKSCRLAESMALEFRAHMNLAPCAEIIEIVRVETYKDKDFRFGVVMSIGYPMPYAGSAAECP